MIHGHNQFDQIPSGFPRRSRTAGLWSSLTWILGLVAGAIAVAVGAVLAVFTAAAVAVIALVGGALLFLTGWAVNARRTVRVRRSTDAPGVIEARKVGHQWVAYGWDRGGR
ncbi:MAG TPA: hypothetical protein VGB49_06430 [Caulobacteraceae bacterium]|jgi:Flp pilus assembly protein TadB